MEPQVSTRPRQDARCEQCGCKLTLEMEHDEGICTECQKNAALVAHV